LKADMIGPIYKKSLYTVRVLLSHLQVQTPSQSPKQNINPETTIRQLVRCQVLFKTRLALLEILALIEQREQNLDIMRKFIATLNSDEEIEGQKEKIKLIGLQLQNLTIAITNCIQNFLTDHKGFGS